jgi:hypothetical protein
LSEYRNVSELIEAANNHEPLSEEENLFLAIWEIIFRPDPKPGATAIPADA